MPHTANCQETQNLCYRVDNPSNLVQNPQSRKHLVLIKPIHHPNPNRKAKQPNQPQNWLKRSSSSWTDILRYPQNIQLCWSFCQRSHKLSERLLLSLGTQKCYLLLFHITFVTPNWVRSSWLLIRSILKSNDWVSQCSKLGSRRFSKNLTDWSSSK